MMRSPSETLTLLASHPSTLSLSSAPLPPSSVATFTRRSVCGGGVRLRRASTPPAVERIEHSSLAEVAPASRRRRVSRSHGRSSDDFLSRVTRWLPKGRQLFLLCVLRRTRARTRACRSQTLRQRRDREDSLIISFVIGPVERARI